MTEAVAVYGMKGGVRKTTLAVNLAYCSAARSSLRTLLRQIDAQGAASCSCAKERPDAGVKRVHQRRSPLLPVITMVDRRRKRHREFVAEHPAWPAIPRASVVEPMAVERSPVTAHASKSPAAQALGELCSTIERLLAVRKSSWEGSGKTLLRISKRCG
jgi:cellulose biosynthesis protein BcsQ